MKLDVVSSLLLLSFYWLCLCNHFFVVSCLCLDDQRSLLLQLNNNLTFTHTSKSDTSSKLKSWNSTHDCCSWMGITCDMQGHVTGLDLSGESTFGGFDHSSSLFNLQYLQKLNLASNSFHFSPINIPSGFNRLENLTYLNLSDAGLYGQIPKEISQLTRLVTLDISTTSLQRLKLENPNLGKLVQNFTNLRQLYLDGVTITDSGEEWCNALLLLKNLQELSMSKCELSGPLDSSLARLKNLSVIVLDRNNLSSPVPEAYANFKNLTTLSLSSCGLTGTFPQKIFQIGTLLVIDISFNNDLHGFFPNFPLSGSLRILKVSKTNFSGAFPYSIGNMQHLSKLDVSYCLFNGTLPNSLSNLVGVQENSET